MNEEDAKTAAEMITNTGTVIANAAALELVCMAWAQALSTDAHAVALFLGERVELPAIRKVIAALARARRPEIADRLAPLLKQAEKHAEFRNVVAHNPQLFSMANKPLSLRNLRKPSAIVAPNDLPTKSKEIGATAKALMDLYIEAFGNGPSYDNPDAPRFAVSATNSAGG